MDYEAENGQYCDTLLQCFTTTAVYGMTAGGGTREVLGPGNTRGYYSDFFYLGRILFDLLFWLFIPVVAMNLILGIIVDTFSELRTEEAERELEFSSKCFICSLPDHEFNGDGGFQEHIETEHNMWNYLYLALQLSQQAENDLTGMNYHEKVRTHVMCLYCFFSNVPLARFVWYPKRYPLSSVYNGH